MTDHIDRAVAVLNEALEADPDCIHALMRVEVGCNERIAEHPTIQVGPSFLDPAPVADTVLRPLGLINGLFGVKDSGSGYIAMLFDDDGALTEFKRL